MRTILDIIREGEHEKLMFHPMAWEEFYKAYQDNLKIEKKYDISTYMTKYHYDELKRNYIDIYPNKFKGETQYYVIFGNTKSDLDVDKILSTLGDKKDTYESGEQGKGYKSVSIYSDGFCLKNGIDKNNTHWVVGMSKEKLEENNIEVFG